MKEPHEKLYSHNEYKKYRHILSTLLKRSKQDFFSNFYESNWNNIKNTWKGIESLITLTDISISVPSTLNHNNSTVTNPSETANNSNNYFGSVAEETRVNVNYSHIYFSEYMEINLLNHFFFLSFTNKNEISSFIFSWIQTSLLVQIAYLQRFLHYLRIKFHLIFVISKTFFFL